MSERDEQLASFRVAYVIGRVIAEKTLKADPAARRLDGLGMAAAIHDMARNMASSLRDEADAAVKAMVEMGWKLPYPDDEAGQPEGEDDDDDEQPAGSTEAGR